MKPTSTSSDISEGPFLLHQQSLGVAKEKPEIQSLYEGWQLLRSPLQERPKILLSGFDPDGGYYSRHSEMVAEFQPMEALEYNLSNQPLAEQNEIAVSFGGQGR